MHKNRVFILVLVLLVLGGGYMFGSLRTNTQKKSINEKQIESVYKELREREDLSVATFSGGCFWCMEGPFQELDGVEEVIAGYAGGEVENPSYEQVLGGKTGHRESVQIFYNPEKVSYEKLLEIYWLQIDPTDDRGQFADRGYHYTTAIYYHNEDQKDSAEKSKKTLDDSGKYDEKIVTEILSFSTFYPAEDYHQDYYLKQKDKYQRYETLSGRRKYKEEIQKKLGL